MWQFRQYLCSAFASAGPEWSGHSSSERSNLSDRISGCDGGSARKNPASGEGRIEAERPPARALKLPGPGQIAHSQDRGVSPTAPSNLQEYFVWMKRAFILLAALALLAGCDSNRTGPLFASGFDFDRLPPPPRRVLESEPG